MAKALVFEGCPACERKSSELGDMGRMRHHYDDMGLGAEWASSGKEFIIGGAVGAGGILVTNMLLSKIMPTMSGMIKNIILAGVVIAGAAYTHDKYPTVSSGLAIGGGAIVLTGFLAPMLSSVMPSAAPSVASVAPTAGLGQVTVTEKPYGVLVAEEVHGLGEEELVVH